MDLPEAVIQDWLAMELGDLLGGGVARKVHRSRGNPNWVIKLEVGEYDFQNVAEWQTWSLAGKKLRKWLAPCVAISPGGRVLIQEFCEPCPRSLIPDQVPTFFDDTHDKNFGWHEGRPVLMDYGRNMAIALASNAKKMRNRSDF